MRPEELYAYAKATGKLCQTAAVNVSDYYAYFSAARAEYDAVIHFTISSDMSGCYQNACIAAREFTNVYPVDARNLSTGIGHLVLDAAEMAAQGMDAADIAAALEKKREARCQLRARHARLSRARRALLVACGAERQFSASQAVHRGQGRENGRRPQVPRQARKVLCAVY